jgi:hypothetical protein
MHVTNVIVLVSYLRLTVRFYWQFLFEEWKWEIKSFPISYNDPSSNIPIDILKGEIAGKN